ncbi:hypothetical protein [Aquisphaera insulae]|uniref:hypothetical protein n=1 Tax=Aquisphaera insulae TaxID=2712864 RepID=UPI0013EA3692|nr:hypothetical protein [Aquisphaera insulae]
METRLSKRLGPAAKKLALLSAEDETVSALIQVAPSMNRKSFEHDVRGVGGVVRAWMPESNLATVDVSAGHLSDVAEMAGVVQVEAGQAYRR